MSKKIKILITTICVLLGLALLGTAAVLGVNAYVKHVAAPRILTAEEAASLSDVDCILVLGCLVKDDGRPSDMLHDRLRRGVELYQAGVAPKLLMSGDHGRENYDEVATMKQFAIDADIPSEDVFMDHAGFSTYESMYRAIDIFQAEKIIIVTQEYHLYRALYLAEKLGIEAYGVSASLHGYGSQDYQDFRESLARMKDFFYALVKPEPTFLGEAIPIDGDAYPSHDNKSST